MRSQDYSNHQLILLKLILQLHWSIWGRVPTRSPTTDHAPTAATLMGVVIPESLLSCVRKPRINRRQGSAAILETHSPSRLLFPSCFTLPYKCNHNRSIATVRFAGQELQDSHHAAPVWSEMMMSADQSPEATTTLPRVAVLPRSQHPVSWFEHRGIEEGIGNSELVKFIDDNTNRKNPRNI